MTHEAVVVTHEAVVVTREAAGSSTNYCTGMLLGPVCT